MRTEVDTDYYFSDESKFPWDLLGLTRPLYGPPHSYLATFLAPFAKSAIERKFLESHPTMREISRYVRSTDDHPEVCRFILGFCEYLDNERSSVAYKVLRGLGQYKPFVSSAAEHLNRLLRRGEISIPRAGLTIYWGES